jgi:hypothetical protein
LKRSREGSAIGFDRLPASTEAFIKAISRNHSWRPVGSGRIGGPWRRKHRAGKGEGRGRCFRPHAASQTGTFLGEVVMLPGRSAGLAPLAVGNKI